MLNDICNQNNSTFQIVMVSHGLHHGIGVRNSIKHSVFPISLSGFISNDACYRTEEHHGTRVICKTATKHSMNSTMHGTQTLCIPQNLSRSNFYYQIVFQLSFHLGLLWHANT